MLVHVCRFGVVLKGKGKDTDHVCWDFRFEDFPNRTLDSETPGGEPQF